MTRSRHLNTARTPWPSSCLLGIEDNGIRLASGGRKRLLPAGLLRAEAQLRNFQKRPTDESSSCRDPLNAARFRST